MQTNEAIKPLVKLSKEQIEDLCVEVKETIATDLNIRTAPQPFGVADLWKIHRNTRYRVQRRNLLF